ncbi:MAG: tetratricopeptide repeat protein [Bacteroidales bacterium]|jgi:tetratricopeptide (TPR) repeat protein|nr:tetratricopeptide repeat protein [Bacteroidales bacterium]
MTEKVHMRSEGTWSRLALFSAILIVLAFPVYLLIHHLPALQGPKQIYGQPYYTGGESCTECHRIEYDLWKGSDHDLAMAHATDESVLGDFNDATLFSQGEEHRFYRRDDRFLVWTQGPDGEMAEFEITYTFGYRPLQQYLVPFEGGRLQCLPLTWDTEKGEWYHMADTVYSDIDLDHHNWLYWTNQAQNWNGMCADCHSTHLQKGYDFVADTFNTSWKDINVHCEACHGAGSEHIKWSKLPEMARLADESMGLLVQTRELDNETYVDRCARCHARRTVFGDFPGYYANLLDYMAPTLLVEPYYFPDGQILEEDYVYASFIHSKMYMTDVKCNDCHDVHSLKLQHEAVTSNELCLQCHRADVYDRYEHHFHRLKGESGRPVVADGKTWEVGSGALCINCHMTGRYYMGVDFRRDHSFRVPRPDLTVETASPNACNYCHSENTPEWAASYIDKWYGLSRRPHFGTVFAAARKNDGKAIPGLIKLAHDELFPPVVRATAIYELERFADSAGRQAVIRSLEDPLSLIRYQALQSYLPSSQEEMIALISPMLNDPVKAVRMQAAFRMSSIPVTSMDSSLLREFFESLDEYREAMEYTGEFAASRHNLGVVYQNLGNYERAEQSFLSAISIDNEFIPSMANLAVTYNQQGKNDKAEEMLNHMIAEFPEYHEAYYSLGLLLAERGDYEGALEALERASELIPDYARIWYNLAQLYQHYGRDDDFVNSMNKALQLEPGNLDFLYILADYYYRKGEYDKVRSIAEEMIERYPGIPIGQQLLDAISSKQ